MRSNKKWRQKDEKMALRISVRGPFISRKTGINWPSVGITKERYEVWVRALQQSLEANKEFTRWLR